MVDGNILQKLMKYMHSLRNKLQQAILPLQHHLCGKRSRPRHLLEGSAHSPVTTRLANDLQPDPHFY
jgi:hypothetical protein